MFPKSAVTSNWKKMFQRLFSTVQPSTWNSSEGEKVVNPKMTLSEKLQNIVDKNNEAEKCSNTERSQYFAKEQTVFESTKERTNNISKLYEGLKLVSPTSVEAEKAFLLLAYSSLNFTADWMIRASMPFVCWGHILWPNKLKLRSRKKIARNILRSEI